MLKYQVSYNCVFNETNALNGVRFNTDLFTQSIFTQNGWHKAILIKKGKLEMMALLQEVIYMEGNFTNFEAKAKQGIIVCQEIESYLELNINLLFPPHALGASRDLYL